MSIYYLNPIMVKEGNYVYAEAKVVKRGKKIIVIKCEIYDNDYTLAAEAIISFTAAKRKIFENDKDENRNYVKSENSNKDLQ